MPINPVNAQLVNVGDVVTAVLQGDPQVILSLSGTFTGAVFQIEGVPQGQTQFIPVAEVRSDTGGLQAGGVIGPLNGAGLGSGLTMRADGGALNQIRIRLTAIGTGAVTGGIATVPFPFASPVQTVAGTVAVNGDYLQQIFERLDALNSPLGMNKYPLTLNLPLRPDLNLISPT